MINVLTTPLVINPNKGYSIAELVRITGKCRTTISNHIRDGILKAYEGRRRVRCSKDGQPLRAMLVKGKDLTIYMNTY